MKNPLKSLLFLVAFVLLVFTSFGQKVGTVDITWDPPADGSTYRYRIYWGAASRNYTNVLDSGLLRTNSITGLVDGARYYFAVTAYNTNGLESDYSNEYTEVLGSRPPAPGTPSVVQRRDVVFIDMRGRTNSNGTVTPVGDVMIAGDIEGSVSVTANVLTNGVVMNSRTVTTTNRVASIAGNRSLARPFVGAIDVTRVSFDPDVREEALYR